MYHVTSHIMPRVTHDIKVLCDIKCHVTIVYKLILSIYINYPNDSNIARANYYFLGPEVRELFEI